MPFHEALALRLSAMQPSKQQLTKMMEEDPLQLTPGVADFISALHSRGQHVYFVSGGTAATAPVEERLTSRKRQLERSIRTTRAPSRPARPAAPRAQPPRAPSCASLELRASPLTRIGFRQMIEPVAAQVNVAKEDIFANTFLWDAEGKFTGHLETEPTSRAGGKAKVVADLKAKHGAPCSHGNLLERYVAAGTASACTKLRFPGPARGRLLARLRVRTPPG